MKNQTEHELIGLEEAAHMLGTSVRHMRRLIEHRRVPYMKLGGLIRFRRSELLDFIERSTISAVAV